jgi:thiazolylpeptide-type bacteriocin precursor
MLTKKLLAEEVKGELHQLDTETFEVEDLIDVEQNALDGSSSSSCSSTSSCSCSCSSCCSCSSSSCCSCSCWHF